MKHFDEFHAEELHEHRIKKIRTLGVRNRYTRLNGKNSVRGEHGYGDTFLVKEITTDKGTAGWGYCLGRPAAGQDADRALLGRTVAELFDPAVGIRDSRLKEYDFALHDLAGRIMGVSVAWMIGHGGQNPVPYYDGAILIDDLSPDQKPEGIRQILKECQDDYALGFRDFKLKIGRGLNWMEKNQGIERDIQVTKLVREYFPESRIMVDINSAYTVDEVKRYVDGAAGCNLYWIEEPFEENLEDDRELKAYLMEKCPRTMIADGEAHPDLELLLRLAEAGALDVLQMDIAGFGFTEWRKILPMLREKKIKISPHNWGWGVKTNYTAALAAAYPYVPSIEGIVDTTEGVDTSGYELVNGKLTVPDLPGFGMELYFGMEVDSVE